MSEATGRGKEQAAAGLGFHTELTSDKDEAMSTDINILRDIDDSENMIQGTTLRESKLSGKNTAATISDPAGFGFCGDENPGKPDKKMKQMEEANKEEKNQVFEAKQAPTEQDIEIQVENMLRYEIGFSAVVRRLSELRKPIVGHNMMMDLCFLYHQCYKQMPQTYPEFALSVIKEFFPTVFDTKVLSMYSQREEYRWGKSDLQHLYFKSTQDKAYCNNLVFEPDRKSTSSAFTQYENKGGQGHDAGFDAYMTGVVFATNAKYFEIGNIVKKLPGFENHNKVVEEEIGLSQTSTLSQADGTGVAGDSTPAPAG